MAMIKPSTIRVHNSFFIVLTLVRFSYFHNVVIWNLLFDGSVKNVTFSTKITET